MKQLLKILGGGLAAFLLVAIVQEWSYFAGVWFGEPPARVTVSDEERESATGAVRQTLTLMRHYYATGGDVRFAERMPVSDVILEEMRADTEYLARNQRRQEPQLMRLEVTSVTPAAAGRIEVRTRELWTVRFRWAAQPGESEPPRIQVVHGRYLTAPGPRGWQVEAWSFYEPGEETVAEGAPGESIPAAAAEAPR